MQKIIPHLWYDHQALEAATFYVSLFKNSRILNVSHYSETVAQAAGQPAGGVMTVAFELDGQQFIALNGGPHLTLTEAFSMLVNCDSQAEVDELWTKLSHGGEESQCGWLKDRFGLSWQIVPTALEALVTGGSAEQADRVMQALLQMKKLDLAALERAYSQA